MTGKIEKALLYSKSHEWIKVEGDSLIIGITDHAQDALGDIVFFDVKNQNQALQAESVFGFIESVKAVEDLYMPVDGTISEVNEELKNSSAKINQDPYNSWLVKITKFNQSQVDGLMSADAYSKFLESL